MRVPRIYLPIPLTSGASVPLNEAAFHHLVRVLRFKPGASLTVFNGQGGEFQGLLTAVERRTAWVRLEAFIPREAESALEVVLVQGIARGERMDYALQKAVELGVAAIFPVLTEHSAAYLKGEERMANRLHHWRAVIAGACEQCGRNRLPPVGEPLELRAWLERHRAAERTVGLVLDPLATRRLGELGRPAGTVALLIGPEGGLSAAEIALAEAAGFTGIRLGPRIMRTETAGVAALTAVQVLWGDLG